jgi:hypothetical protein
MYKRAWQNRFHFADTVKHRHSEQTKPLFLLQLRYLVSNMQVLKTCSHSACCLFTSVSCAVLSWKPLKTRPVGRRRRMVWKIKHDSHKKNPVNMRTKLRWLWIRSSGELLWWRWWTFGFRSSREFSDKLNNYQLMDKDCSEWKVQNSILMHYAYPNLVKTVLWNKLLLPQHWILCVLIFGAVATLRSAY